MILSNQAFTVSTTMFAEFPQALRELMIKSTVKLDTGKLKASGVIFNVKNNLVEILTAAHNILLNHDKKQRLPPNNWTEWSKEYCSGLTVRYNPAGLTFNGAPSAQVAYNKNSGNITVAVPNVDVGCQNQADCYYDLAVITCTDNDFATFAKTFLGNEYDLSAAAKKATENETFLKLKLDGATEYFHSGHKHFQLGYGKTTESRFPLSISQQKIAMGDAVVKTSGVAANAMAEYNLHYRLTKPKADAYSCFYDQIAEKDKAPAYCKNCAAFELDGDATSTSAEGDSGGPIYAIQYDNEKIINPQTKEIIRRTITFGEATLIGLTTGSDMETAKQLPGAH